MIQRIDHFIPKDSGSSSNAAVRLVDKGTKAMEAG